MTSLGHGLRLLVLGLVLPQALFAVSPKVVSRKLESVGLVVNGEDRQLARDSTLQLIKGDELVLVYASLEGTQVGPSALNFIGYRNLVKGKLEADDRNILIKTEALSERDKDRFGVSNYRVEAKTGTEVFGHIKVAVMPPLLKSLELLINGSSRTVRDQETLTLKAQDSFQVTSIQTNDPRIDKEARIAMKALSGPQEGVEIKVFYRTHAFASIRVLLRSL